MYPGGGKTIPNKKLFVAHRQVLSLGHDQEAQPDRNHRHADNDDQAAIRGAIDPGDRVRLPSARRRVPGHPSPQIMEALLEVVLIGGTQNPGRKTRDDVMDTMRLIATAQLMAIANVREKLPRLFFDEYYGDEDRDRG